MWPPPGRPHRGGMDITLRHTRRADGVTDAVRDLAPVVLGLAPFAMLIGVTAVRSGLGAGTGVLSSALLYGGSGQLTAITLMGSGAGAGAVLAAVTLVNARFLLYAARARAPLPRPAALVPLGGGALRRRPHLRDGDAGAVTSRTRRASAATGSPPAGCSRWRGWR